MTMTIEELEKVVVQAIDHGILGIEIVDAAPVDADGNPQTHCSGRTEVSHLAYGDDGKLYIGAVFGAWQRDKPIAAAPVQRSGSVNENGD